jgi:peroxiredoxin
MQPAPREGAALQEFRDEFRDEFGFIGPMPISSNQRRIPDEGFPTGPELGERFPDFALTDHTGRKVSFHGDRAGAKAAVVFFRSVVWSPPCLTHLGELQGAFASLESAGVKLYAVSYDERDALAEFAHARGIKYTLLSDPDSAVIRRFGILNTLLSPSDTPFHGVPYPGTYLLDGDGVVRDKFFRRHVANRESAETLIDAALGRIGDERSGPRATGGDADAQVTVFMRGGGGSLKSGPVRRLVVRLEPQEGLYVCGASRDCDVPGPAVEIAPVKGLHVEPAIVPPTDALALRDPPITVPVWSRLDIAIPIWADSDLVSVMAPPAQDEITLDLSIRYQLCDTESLHAPRRERLSLRVPLAVDDVPNLPQISETGHAVVPMSSLKHFRRLLRRARAR